MLKDRIKTVIKAIGATHKTVSEYAGIASANIGKLTNGSRVPAKESSTAGKLVNGIYGAAQKNRKIGVLCDTIGCGHSGEQKAKQALLDWLYEDTPQASDSALAFAGRLNSILSTVGTDSRELIIAAGADLTMINRFREGDRLPTRRSRVLNSMCEYIAEAAVKNGSTHTVAELIGIPENDMPEVNAAPMIRDWLLGIELSPGSLAAANIVTGIISPAGENIVLPDVSSIALPEIINEDRTQYIGIEGLQRAVIRFLGNTAKKPGTELFLYSDQSMEWMQARYTPKWLALMNECLRSGTKIRIIHNIERSTPDMLFAVRNWLPLYMTGQIEPYYRIDKSGSRFCHTVFMSDDACIDGFCAVGMERKCVYHYNTDSGYIGSVKDSFSKLSLNIKPLLRFERGVFEPHKNYTAYDCDSVRILISDRDAVICKDTEPACSFRFTHPYLVSIFTAYAKSFSKKNRQK